MSPTRSYARSMAVSSIAVVVFMAAVFVSWCNVHASPAPFPGKKSNWNGFVRHDFAVDGRAAFVIVPKGPAEGRPWIWRARFPNYHASVNLALLKRGFHVAYINTDGMFGSDGAIKRWDRFYDQLTGKHALSDKPALMAVSRGGLFAYRWAARNPDRVACIYGVVPVCDFKSWPLGRGSGTGSPAAWKQLLSAYRMTPAQALRFKSNPIDVLEPIAKADVPILHLVSRNDKVVPPAENTDVLRERYARLGGSMRVAVHKGATSNKGHRFDDDSPEHAVAFIAKHASGQGPSREDSANRCEVDACDVSQPDPVVAALVANEGNYSTAVRDTYLRSAETQVLRRLAGADRTLPNEFIAWVRSDAVVYEAAYGSIYPADPRIVLNLYELRKALEPEVFKRQKHLVIAAAVTRRSIGVGSVGIGNTYGATLATAWRRDHQRGVKIERDTLDAKQPGQPADRSVRLSRGSKLIDVYLQEHEVDTRQVFNDARHRAALIASMNKGGVKMTAGKPYVRAIERYLLESGKRPTQRDAHPSVAQFIRYLDDKRQREVDPFRHKKKGLIRWPLFRSEQTPWPMLMPLTRTYPIREAEYIWNGFANHQRYQAYGPYRRAVGRWPLIVEPSPWSYDSWPSQARIGGLCGTMSTISMGTHVALGVPVLKGSQPGHSCVVKYERDGRGFYKVTIGQAVSGPNATKCAWLFADPHAGGVSAKERTFKVDMSYHFGLAQAMNVGLREYMDTRIAVNVYRSLDPEQRTRYGRALLLSATEINPYNVELWNLLSLTHAKDEVSVVDRAAVLRRFNKTVRDSRFEMEPWEERSPDEDLSDGDDNAAANNASMAGHVAAWATMVRPKLTRLVTSRPIPTDEATLRVVCDALRPTGGPAYIRYAMRLDDGRADVVKMLQNRIRQHRSLRGKGKPQARLRTAFVIELKLALSAIDESNDKTAFIDAIAEAYPPNQQGWTYRKKFVRDPIYVALESVGDSITAARVKEAIRQ